MIKSLWLLSATLKSPTLIFGFYTNLSFLVEQNFAAAFSTTATSSKDVVTAMLLAWGSFVQFACSPHAFVGPWRILWFMPLSSNWTKCEV